jgi:hypothetical protein
MVQLVKSEYHCGFQRMDYSLWSRLDLGDAVTGKGAGHKGVNVLFADLGTLRSTYHTGQLPMCSSQFQ